MSNSTLSIPSLSGVLGTHILQRILFWHRKKSDGLDAPATTHSDFAKDVVLASEGVRRTRMPLPRFVSIPARTQAQRFEPLPSPTRASKLALVTSREENLLCLRNTFGSI